MPETLSPDLSNLPEWLSETLPHADELHSLVKELLENSSENRTNTLNSFGNALVSSNLVTVPLHWKIANRAQRGWEVAHHRLSDGLRIFLNQRQHQPAIAGGDPSEMQDVRPEYTTRSVQDNVPPDKMALVARRMQRSGDNLKSSKSVQVALSQSIAEIRGNRNAIGDEQSISADLKKEAETKVDDKNLWNKYKEDIGVICGVISLMISLFEPAQPQVTIIHNHNETNNTYVVENPADHLPTNPEKEGAEEEISPDIPDTGTTAPEIRFVSGTDDEGDTAGLLVRSEPKLGDNVVHGIIENTQVKVLQKGGDFWLIEFQLNGTSHQGYAHKDFLREPDQ